ncbi:MAG: hypothetical protein ACE5PT_02880 [Gemmatimonadales bacterium]
MREALLEAGGALAAGTSRSRLHLPPANPFATARQVEASSTRIIPVEPAEPLDSAAFLDGIQRYSIEGWIGLVPVVRGYAAAAVLQRKAAELKPRAVEREEFLAVELDRLEPKARDALESAGLALHDVGPSDERRHPILDIHRAAQVVERRRELAERAVCSSFLREQPDSWLIVDGSIADYAESPDRAHRLVGLVKSHETQFLEGPDLQAALTLPAGHRTTVFARGAGKRATVFTWYLRLWPWEEHDLLHGLVRVERKPGDAAVEEATQVSRWILAERAPLTAPDGRWDRLVYPIQQVETYLRAQEVEA